MINNPTAQEAADFFMRDFEKNKADRKKAHIELLQERIEELESRVLKDQAEIARRRKEIDTLLAQEQE